MKMILRSTSPLGFILCAATLVGCAAPDAEDEWVDATTQEVACTATPRMVGAEVLGSLTFGPEDRIISDLTGRLYVVDGAGDLWLLGTDEKGMTTGAGEKLAEGWGGFRTVLAAGDGVLYAIDEVGAVHWYRHFASETGEVLWADESGRVILEGFADFEHVVSGGDGVIYAVDKAGALHWYLHVDPDDGEAEWAEGSGNVIADGWQFAAVTSAGDGLLYGVGDDGEVRAYTHEDPTAGEAIFSAESGRVVDRGFAQMATIAAYTPACDADAYAIRAALVRWGMFPAASDAYRKTGLSASRIMQTIGNAPASAGYHARDGFANGQPYTAATDISTRGLSRTFIRRLLERMGRLGFAGFYRWPGHDGWPSSQIAHIHTNWAGCRMKSQLVGQIHDWLNGRNGLASNGAYTFYRPSTTAKNKVRCLLDGTNCGGGGGGGSGGGCVNGGFYCGGDKVTGSSTNLYRCTGSGAPSLVAKCANGCAVNSGRDDSCRSPDACVRGGAYCGGDKINGHPSVLYRCNGSSAPSVIRRCTNGCVVAAAGQDDHCR